MAEYTFSCQCLYRCAEIISSGRSQCNITRRSKTQGRKRQRRVILQRSGGFFDHRPITGCIICTHLVCGTAVRVMLYPSIRFVDTFRLWNLRVTGFNWKLKNFATFATSTTIFLARLGSPGVRFKFNPLFCHTQTCFFRDKRGICTCSIGPCIRIYVFTCCTICRSSRRRATFVRCTLISTSPLFHHRKR